MIESNLGPLPNRVSVLEETTHSLEAQVHDVSTQMNQLDADLQELDAEFTAKEARDSGFTTQELTEKIKQLEAQVSELTLNFFIPNFKDTSRMPNCTLRNRGVESSHLEVVPCE